MARLPGSNIVAPFIYGTAWKKGASATLVHQALEAGFRAIDTAAQPKHYQENLVGEGIRQAINGGLVTRQELHLQTKYTPPNGQDPKDMPYKPSDPIQTQVRDSVLSSLKNLKFTDTEDEGQNYIDCLILHSPLSTFNKTLEAWQSMTSFLDRGVRTIGVSNINLTVLRTLYKEADIVPSVVQNRFHKGTGYDADVRAFCQEKGIVYESFWTLTANPQLLKSSFVQKVADAVGVDREMALYGLVGGLDVTILNGTTNADTMRNDLSGWNRFDSFKNDAKNIQTWNEWMKDISVMTNSQRPGSS